MLDLGTLQAHLQVDGVDNFNSSLQEASSSSDKAASGMKASFKLAAAQIAAGFVAVVSAAKDVFVRIKGLTDGVAEYGDAVDKGAQKMQVSTDTYQEWSFVLERSGSNIETLQRGMKTLNTAIDGNSSAFSELGVSTTKADGSLRSTEDILNDTMFALAGVGDEHKRYALAVDLFGKKTASELLPALNSGKKGIKDMMDYAHKNNLIMSGEGVAASAEYQDAMGDLNLATQGLKTTIGVELMPIITDIVNKIVDDVIPAIENFTKDNEWLLPTIAGLTTALITFKAAMGISAIISGVSKALAAYRAANEGATIAQWALNAAIGANPIAIVVSLIAGLVVAIVLLWKKSEGFRNGVLKVWGAVKGAVQGAIDAIKGKFEQWKAAFQSLHQAISQKIGAIKAKFQAFKSAVSSIAGAVVGRIRSLVSGIGSAFNQIPHLISRVVGWFKGLPGRIVSAIGNMGSLLLGAGRNLMSGLFKGIAAGWEAIKSKVSGMGSWIKEHKGPKDYDLHLLVENGQWIMSGLMDGINSSMPALKQQLSGVASTIQGTNFNANANLAFAGGVAGYAPGSNDTTYNVYIDGTKINDDAQIEGKFKDLLTSMARKGMM